MNDNGNSGYPLTTTSAAMLAFAANSILCRLALGTSSIDAASFTLVRVACAGMTLFVLIRLRSGARAAAPPNWRSAAALLVYLIFFSFAYNSLDAGVGALILFSAVQLTMFAAALHAGERLDLRGLTGFVIAALGLLYLTSPGASAPAPAGSIMMAVAGIAWGIYSLRGRGVADPMAATAGNFIVCIPAALLISVVFLESAHCSTRGLLLAAASGSLASALGYAIWYTALRRLTASHAATVQLSVPIIAAFGGVLLLGETLTPRLVIASTATLGGVALVLAPRLNALAPIGKRQH